jgi:hypothetical protein
MKERRKSRAFNAPYESQRQMVLRGFETPFERELEVRTVGSFCLTSFPGMRYVEFTDGKCLFLR